MLVHNRHVAKYPLPQYVCGKVLSKNVAIKVLMQLTVFKNKDRHIAKALDKTFFMIGKK
jgi:hypothetical protein